MSKHKKHEDQSTNSATDNETPNKTLSNENSSTKELKGTFRIAQKFETFAPSIASFLKLGEEIIELYEKAKHNRELCGFLLKRSNCAMAAVKDLDMRKTEDVEFFSKQENLDLLQGFIKCMTNIKEFISRVSELHKLMKYIFAYTIENDLKKLVEEFDGYMMSLNFSFTIQSRDESIKIKDYVIQIHELLSNVYSISSDKQSQQIFLNQMDLVIKKLKSREGPDELITSVEENEPLLDGNNYQRTKITPSKLIEKRTSFKDSTDVSFKEFTNITSSKNVDTNNTSSKNVDTNNTSSKNVDTNNTSSKNVDTQIEIRRQVNILKILKNSDHIIRFFGVAQEDTKFYLVTEWMDYGNLRQYYKKFEGKMGWETKIRFALDICRGVTYLHDCKILHHDIQPANILVNKNHKVRVANFGLSRKFSDLTRSVRHDSENIRYMAPEKLLLKKHENRDYDAKCEIYSVGVLLWEIAELKIPHSEFDFDKSELMVIIEGIRNRMRDGYYEPFSNDVPSEWKHTVSRAIEYEPRWRLNLSDICREFYKLSEKYSKLKSFLTIKILSVDDAIREHKSNNGDKVLAWNSFKFYSITNVEARYWVGYYYYYHGEEIPELQSINKEERDKNANDIFKETAERGHSSAQLRYGMHLWERENYIEAFKYLKMSADAEDAYAMYLVGKAYWTGSKGIEQDKEQGAKYLRDAALKNHTKAIEMCDANKISYQWYI